MIPLLPRIRELFPPSSHKRVYLVGGCLRDQFLGREQRDIDLAAALDAEELLSLGFHPVRGKTTAPIWFRNDDTLGNIEVIPLSGGDDLHRDLSRRDFTINAMAMDLAGRLRDPLGGLGDLERRALRTCSPRTFSDDPLRIFRAFRFEADDWDMTPETGNLIRMGDWEESLALIPVERFSREMVKACSSPRPERFFQRMTEFSIGTGYLPELFAMPAIPAGPVKHHPEGDLLSHSIQVLQRVTPLHADPLIRFCALFHDLGKLSTDPALYPRHHGHDLAGAEPARELCDRLRLPASYRSALSWICRLHTKYNNWEQLRDSTRLKIAAQALKAGIGLALPLVSAADKAVAPELASWKRCVRTARMSAAELGMDPGRLNLIPVNQRQNYVLQKRVEKLRMTEE